MQEEGLETNKEKIGHIDRKERIKHQELKGAIATKKLRDQIGQKYKDKDPAETIEIGIVTTKKDKIKKKKLNKRGIRGQGYLIVNKTIMMREMREEDIKRMNKNQKIFNRKKCKKFLRKKLVKKNKLLPNLSLLNQTRMRRKLKKKQKY